MKNPSTLKFAARMKLIRLASKDELHALNELTNNFLKGNVTLKEYRAKEQELVDKYGLKDGA